MNIIKTNKGFTLIELVMVIVILGALAAVALPKFIDMRDQARISGILALRWSIYQGSADNILAKKLGNPAAITLDGPNVCTRANIQALLSTPLDPNIQIIDRGFSCAGSAESVTCQAKPIVPTYENDNIWNFGVLCAR